MEPMTAEEKHRFDRVEQHIKEMQKDLTNILSALVGNQANGNKGFVHSFDDFNKRLDEQDAKIELLQKTKIEHDVATRIGAWVIGILSSIGIGLTIYYSTKK